MKKDSRQAVLIAVTVAALTVSCLTLCSVAGPQEVNAPLPDQIVSAKTVYLINETGKAKFGDAVYKQIRTWNRWQVITDKSHADLVLVVTDKGGMKSFNPSFYLNVIDPKTGTQLWTCRTTMQGKLWRSWDSVAKTLSGYTL